MKPIAYGIDFGTTNSCIAASFDDGSVQVLTLDKGGSFMPSLVYLERGGARVAGASALRSFLNTATSKTTCGRCELVSWRSGSPDTSCRQVRPGGDCLDARLLSEIKSQMADLTFGYTHSWGRDFRLEDFVGTVISSLKKQADRFFDADVRRVVLGHPVRFVGTPGEDFDRLQARAISRLVRGAQLAGFEDVKVLPESQAAVVGEGQKDGLVVCVDFGGGTFDTAVVDVDGDHAEVLALDGVPVGGERFNGLIFDEVVRPAMGLDVQYPNVHGESRQLPARLRRNLRSLSGLKTLLNDDSVGLSLASLIGGGKDSTAKIVSELLYGGQAWPFFQSIEQAKLDLSTEAETTVRFRRPWLDLDLPLSRSLFEQMISADLDRTIDCLDSALADAQVSATDVDFVASTGGSSQIPAFRDRVRRLFPHAELVESDPFTTVAKGLARYGWEEWAA